MKVIAIDTLKREIEKRFCDGCRSKDREEFKAGYCCDLAQDTMDFIDTLPTIEVESIKITDRGAKMDLAKMDLKDSDFDYIEEATEI